MEHQFIIFGAIVFVMIIAVVVISQIKRISEERSVKPEPEHYSVHMKVAKTVDPIRIQPARLSADQLMKFKKEWNGMSNEVVNIVRYK